MMKRENRFCVIMAGGIGSRFWPLSTTEKPKQFLDILGVGRSLLQLTYERYSKFFSQENIFIVANVIHQDLIEEQLSQAIMNNILYEPLMRNTAPCVAYAMHKIKQRCPHAITVIAPSDHIILNEDQFYKELQKGVDFVDKNDVFITLGIEPSRPEVEYGYIQIHDQISYKDIDNLYSVKTFSEKPSLEIAEMFVASEEFFWNSGIFIWSIDSIMEAFSKHLPDVQDLFVKGISHYDTDSEVDFIRKTYSECPNISIDYGILEKAENVYVLISSFGWSDMGSWTSVGESYPKKTGNNVIIGSKPFLYDTRDCIMITPQKKKVVIQGLENFIIIDTDDTLLICDKREEKQIRQFKTDILLSEEYNNG